MIIINLDVKPGDKVVAKEQINICCNHIVEEGDVFDVRNTSSYSTVLVKDNFVYEVSNNILRDCFTKYIEPQEDICDEDDEECDCDEHCSWVEQMICKESEIIVSTVFDRCTVVSCKLPNGFIVTESSACVDEDDYDEEYGISVCLNKIISKVEELEVYHMKSYEQDMDCDGDCENCEYAQEYEETELNLECETCPEKTVCQDSPHYIS